MTVFLKYAIVTPNVSHKIDMLCESVNGTHGTSTAEYLIHLHYLSYQVNYLALNFLLKEINNNVVLTEVTFAYITIFIVACMVKQFCFLIPIEDNTVVTIAFFFTITTNPR